MRPPWTTGQVVRAAGGVERFGTGSSYNRMRDAGVAELADARDLKSRGRKAVRVRPPPPAPFVLSNFRRSAITARHRA